MREKRLRRGYAASGDAVMRRFARLCGIFDAVIRRVARLCGIRRCGYAARCAVIRHLTMRLEGIFDAAEGLGIIIGLSHAAQAAA